MQAQADKGCVVISSTPPLSVLTALLYGRVRRRLSELKVQLGTEDFGFAGPMDAAADQQLTGGARPSPPASLSLSRCAPTRQARQLSENGRARSGDAYPLIP